MSRASSQGKFPSGTTNTVEAPMQVTTILRGLYQRLHLQVMVMVKSLVVLAVAFHFLELGRRVLSLDLTGRGNVLSAAKPAFKLGEIHGAWLRQL